MKRFAITSSLLIAAILIFFGMELLSQNNSNKIKSFNKSIEYEALKQYSNAIAELTNIYDQNKNDYLINLRLGWLYYLNGENEKSKRYYEAAINLKKNSTEALLGLTYPLAKLEDWSGIENVYNKILKLDANNYSANLYLGQIYLNKGEYAKAQSLLGRAHDFNPSEYEPAQSLAWAYYYLGKTQHARELFTNILMISKNDSLASLGLKLVK